MSTHAKLASEFFHSAFEKLSSAEKRVINDILERRRTSRDVVRDHEEALTFGQRVADRVASFGGSWTFILMFVGILVIWVVVNSFVLLRIGDQAFDPYPYILLNLFLSMVAAFQAPVIMMSQNRQAARDRADQAHDYEVNLKTEMELMQLHDKVDMFVREQLVTMLDQQHRQIELMEKLLDRVSGAPPPNSAEKA